MVVRGPERQFQSLRVIYLVFFKAFPFLLYLTSVKEINIYLAITILYVFQVGSFCQLNNIRVIYFRVLCS